MYSRPSVGNASRKPADRLLFLCFIGWLLWLPLPLGSEPQWAQSFMQFTAFMLMASWVVLYSTGRIAGVCDLRQFAYPLVCLMLFGTVNLIQLLPLPQSIVQRLRPVLTEYESGQWLALSVNSVASWQTLLSTLSFLTIVFLLFQLITSRKRLKTLLTALVLSGVGQAVYGSVMTLSGAEMSFFIPKTQYRGAATGTFEDRTHYAAYLVLALSVGVGLLLAEIKPDSSTNWKARGRRLIAALLGNTFKIRVGLAVMVIALVLSRSRIGNFTFFTTLLTTGAVWAFLTGKFNKKTILLLTSLVVIDVFIVGAWFGLDKVKQRLETTSMATEERLDVAADTWKMVGEHPLLGAGGGTFRYIYPQYRTSDISNTYEVAYNDYLQFLAEYGFIGFAPLLFLQIGALVRAVKRTVTTKSSLAAAMVFATLMSASAMMVYSTLESQLQVNAIGITYLLLLCLPWVRLKSKSECS